MFQSGSPTTSTPSIDAMPALTSSAAVRICRAASRYPSSPIDTMAAQQAADSAPARDPANVGE